MSYVKTSWVARVGTALNRFLKTNETSTEVELTNDPTGVSVPGTPFTVANMNKIEQGIYDAHVTADANASNLLANINQGVKTTDSPTFANMNPPVDNNDDSLPAIGIGGFTYGYKSPRGSFTMPTGGIYMVIGSNGSYNAIERVSGGSQTTNDYLWIAVFRLS